MITQKNFSVLKGHVTDGQQVLMNDGLIFKINQAFIGWNIEFEGRITKAFISGVELEFFIVNYNL